MNTVINSSQKKIDLEKTYQIEDFFITIESNLYSVINDIDYYQVKIKNNSSNANKNDDEILGLLRIGSSEGGLKRELELREKLGKHKMVSKLLACQTSEEFWDNNLDEKSTIVHSSETELKENNDTVLEAKDDISEIDIADESVNSESENEDINNCGEKELHADNNDLQTGIASCLPKTIKINDELNEESNNELEVKSDEENEYLEEEYYEEQSLISEGEQLIILTKLPTSEETLNTWLKSKKSPTDSLLLVSQVTQFFRQVVEQGWCFISLFPQFIQQSQQGKPIQFFDLTNAYPLGEELTQGMLGDYYAPEIMTGEKIAETMSTYVVGTLLYQALQNKLPSRHDQELIDFEESLDLELPKIPRIHQILSICLGAFPEHRFSLSQLLNLLISTRKHLDQKTVRWKTSSHSTLGLSLKRLENEDNYGILQPSASNEKSFILAVVADGMGGMAKGEVASKTAVETIFNNPIPSDLDIDEKRNQWLISLVGEANKAVCTKARNGGTTLSVVLGIDRKLYIAHVGDSRIFLLRNGIICQLSQDHSLVAMLLATEQISYEESQNHPDKNMLTKSLGSNPTLPHNYVQNLTYFGGESFLTLEDGDILLMCSDGVWDLVNAQQLADNFTPEKDQDVDLDLAVKKTIQQVIENGAHDNATLVALKCRLENNPF